MDEHESYMQDFMKVFETLERWGPGSQESTLRALDMLPRKPRHILEIGCGTGLSTVLLAENCNADIVATDNQQSALDSVNGLAARKGLDERIRTVNASMTELPFSDERFDVIWAEGCAYVMGVENALTQWKRLLKNNGILAFSDLVWLTQNPHSEADAFWNSEYPDIQRIETRKQQIEQAGFRMLGEFTLDRQAWENYYAPLKARVSELSASMAGSQALKDIGNEIEMYEKYLDEFGYQMFIIEKR